MILLVVEQYEEGTHTDFKSAFLNASAPSATLVGGAFSRSQSPCAAGQFTGTFNDLGRGCFFRFSSHHESPRGF
jgi:hypothetical protein